MGGGGAIAATLRRHSLEMSRNARQVGAKESSSKAFKEEFR
jgi:hypothetical protein